MQMVEEIYCEGRELESQFYVICDGTSFLPRLAYVTRADGCWAILSEIVQMKDVAYDDVQCSNAQEDHLQEDVVQQIVRVKLNIKRDWKTHQIRCFCFFFGTLFMMQIVC